MPYVREKDARSANMRIVIFTDTQGSSVQSHLLWLVVLLHLIDPGPHDIHLELVEKGQSPWLTFVSYGFFGRHSLLYNSSWRPELRNKHYPV